MRVDPIERIRHDPLALESHQGRLCPMHQRIDDGTATIEAAIQDANIEGLLRDSERPDSLEHSRLAGGRDWDILR